LAAKGLDEQRAGHLNEGVDLPLHASLPATLREITERLAGELARPTLVAPDWSPIEWRLARAVAVIHCVSPLLSGSLRWSGPAQWRDFLAGQKAHVTARHSRIQELLDQIDGRSRQAGIGMVGLKGAALHSMGFYGAGERPMADIHEGLGEHSGITSTSSCTPGSPKSCRHASPT
jgi:Uncharacterised nucleotidyltransferase